MAYTRLQHTKESSTDGTTAVTSVLLDTSGADLIVLVIVSDRSDTSYTVADTKANTWTPLTLQTAASDVSVRIYYCQGGTVGTLHGFSVTLASFPALTVLVYSGSAASPFDQENGNTATAAASCASGSITPTQTNELIVAAAGFSGGVAAVSGGTTLAVVDSNTEASQSWGIANAEEIQTAATAIQATFSKAGSFNYAVAIASFKAADGVGGGGETITVDKWHPPSAQMARRRIGMVPSGTVGIRTP